MPKMKTKSGAEEAFSLHGIRQGEAWGRGQAPRHDEAGQPFPASGDRHGDRVRARYPGIIKRNFFPYER